jgi:hypothetical protein
VKAIFNDLLSASASATSEAQLSLVMETGERKKLREMLVVVRKMALHGSVRAARLKWNNGENN